MWSLQFAPDRRLCLTEQFGRIRVVSAAGHLEPTPWASIRGVPALEGDLFYSTR